MRCTPTFGLLPLFYFCLVFFPLTAVWDRVVAHHALVIATGVVTSAPSREAGDSVLYLFAQAAV